MLLNAAKCQGYIFYRFWVTKEKPTDGVKLTTPSTRLPYLLIFNCYNSFALSLAKLGKDQFHK